MKLFRARPLTLVFLCFFIASCLFAYAGFYVRAGTATAAALGITLILTGAVCLRDPELRQGILAFCAGIAAAGLVSSLAWDFAVPWYESRIGRSEEAVFRIVECEYTTVYASRYDAEVMESSLLPRGTRVVLETALSGLGEGDLLRGEASYGSLAELGTESRNARLSRLADGFVLTAEGSFTHEGVRHSLRPSVLFSRLRGRLTSVFTARAGRDAGGLAAAVLLGNRSFLPDSLKRDFRRLGLAHLLAVSGTHFAVTMSFFTRLFGRLRIRRRPRALLSMAVILFFMLLTGGSPSVVRAGSMHLLIQLSRLASRRVDTIHSFALSGALMVLIRPLSAADCSLQLSFAATWACIVWLAFRGSFLRTNPGKKAGPVRRLIRSGGETVLLTAAATLMTLPLIWLYFGELPLLSVPANLLTVPFVTLLLEICWLCLLLSPVRVLSAPLFALLDPAFRLLSAAASALARIPGAVISVRYGFAPFLLIPAAVCLFAVPLFERKGKGRAVRAAVMLTALLFAGCGIGRALSRDDVVLIRSGIKKNEGFLLQADNRILLCDMSDGSSAVFGTLTARMDDCHACEIDAVVLTHYHSRHSQLLGRLFSREIVRSLWLPEPQTDAEGDAVRTLTGLCAENGVEVRMLAPGEDADFHGVSVRIPERTYLSRSSHPVSGAAVELPSGTLVFASCSFGESESLLREAEGADILILGNHSPVYKKTFALSPREGTKAVALCADAEDHADPGWLGALEEDPACRVVRLGETSVFILRDRRVR